MQILFYSVLSLLIAAVIITLCHVRATTKSVRNESDGTTNCEVPEKRIPRIFHTEHPPATKDFNHWAKEVLN